jgi:hypothetical protein
MTNIRLDPPVTHDVVVTLKLDGQLFRGHGTLVDAARPVLILTLEPLSGPTAPVVDLSDYAVTEVAHV